MLVLSRQRNESIIICPPGCAPIKIVVVDIRGDKVRLGIIAPKEIPCHREEVFEAIQRENVRSARASLLRNSPASDLTKSDNPQ